MKRSSPTKILITYGWCRTAYAAAESLAKAGYAVYGCDDSRWNMLSSSRHVRGFDVVASPFRSPRQFVDDLAAVIRKRGIDILLPVHEDALPISRFRDVLPKSTIVISPPLEVLERANDKLEIVRAAEKAGVPVPRTIGPSTTAEAAEAARVLDPPLILKTRRGNSGKGVAFVTSRAETAGLWAAMISRFRLPQGREPIVQEYIQGDLYGSCFLASEGRVKAVFSERYLRSKAGKFGTSVIREPVDWPLLADYTRRIASELRWTGIGHLDFVGRRDAGRAWLLEMNPRFWGALNLAIQNGYDFPLGLVTQFERGEPDPAAFSRLPRAKRSIWVLGELIAGLNETVRQSPAAILSSLGRILFPERASGYDDFRWGDPLVLAAEMAQYLFRFWKSGFSTNPIDEEMMR
jgi:predicted ATP-grasp superfamily ATP-dependent carboligase